jgi:flagellar hook-length control protein FliK
VHQEAQLHELPERAVESIRIAVRDQLTETRIVLRPAELGEVRINLRHDAAGITATVLVDAAAARDALLGSVPELRAALESQGLNVQSLDVDVRRDDRSAAQADTDGEGRSASDRDGGSHSDDDRERDEPLRRAAERLYGGDGLVDVLA